MFSFLMIVGMIAGCAGIVYFSGAGNDMFAGLCAVFIFFQAYYMSVFMYESVKPIKEYDIYLKENHLTDDYNDWHYDYMQRKQ